MVASELVSATETVGLLKGAVELVKSLVGIKDTSVIHSKITELNAQILAAQSSALAANIDQFTLLQSVRDLEEEVRKLKAWDAEKQNYELKQIRSGVFVFAPKEGVTEGRPDYYLCATCYEQRIKSILQKEVREPRADVWVCNTCQSEIYETGTAYRAPAPIRRR